MEFHMPHPRFNDSAYIVDERAYQFFLWDVYEPAILWARCWCWAASQQFPVAQVRHSSVVLVIHKEREIAVCLSHAAQDFLQVQHPAKVRNMLTHESLEVWMYVSIN